MNHGDHTWATIPSGEHGDTATIDGVALSCVLRGMHTIWLPASMAHMTHVGGSQ